MLRTAISRETVKHVRFTPARRGSFKVRWAKIQETVGSIQQLEAHDGFCPKHQCLFKPVLIFKQDQRKVAVLWVTHVRVLSEKQAESLVKQKQKKN